MGPEIEMSYPVPRRRVLNLLKLRRAALRIFDFAGAVCVLASGRICWRARWWRTAQRSGCLGFS